MSIGCKLGDITGREIDHLLLLEACTQAQDPEDPLCPREYLDWSSPREQQWVLLSPLPRSLALLSWLHWEELVYETPLPLRS